MLVDVSISKSEKLFLFVRHILFYQQNVGFHYQPARAVGGTGSDTLQKINILLVTIVVRDTMRISV